MESRFAAERRPAMRGPFAMDVASPTTNLPTTGLSTMDPATTRHTPANTVRCNDLLSANPSPGLMTLGY